MMDALKTNWWLIVVRGVLALLFGVLAFIVPGATLATLVILYGAYALVDGIFALIVAAKAPQGSDGRGTLALLGILSAAAGAVTFVYPGVTAVGLVYIIGAWALLKGMVEISAAIQLRKQISNEWLLALAGVASVAFGVLLFINPSAGALSLVWIIGFYAVLYGMTLLVLAYKLRRLGDGIRTVLGASR